MKFSMKLYKCNVLGTVFSAKPITILPCSRQREAVESGSLAAERADRDGPIISVCNN